MKDDRCALPGAQCVKINMHGISFAQAQKLLESQAYSDALTIANFNRTEAAQSMGISLKTFRRRLSHLNLKVTAA